MLFEIICKRYRRKIFQKILLSLLNETYELGQLENLTQLCTDLSNFLHTLFYSELRAVWLGLFRFMSVKKLIVLMEYGKIGVPIVSGLTKAWHSFRGHILSKNEKRNLVQWLLFTSDHRGSVYNKGSIDKPSIFLH